MELNDAEIEEDPYENMSIDIILREKYPGASWDLINDTYEGLNWDDTNTIPKPTLDELKEKWLEVNEDMVLITLRPVRKAILEKTDKYSLPDWPHKSEEDKQAWLDFRQSLRDMTSNIQLDEEGEVIWPTRPDGKNTLHAFYTNQD